MNPQTDVPEVPDLPDLSETTMETLEISTFDSTAIEALHQDVIACRDLLTILVAILLAYTASKIILGWFNGR